MPEQNRVSEAEWQVMKLLWKDAPQTANEISDVLAPLMGWSPQTVKTLVGRLQRKGFLDYEKEGRAFLFSPVYDEEELLGEETVGFLDRCFDGSVSSLLKLMLDQGEVSKKELNRLEKVLKGKKKMIKKKDRKETK